MDKARTPEGRARAWIEGVLAQAAHDDVAARTRPFLANQDRLVEQFPGEQQASVDLLVELLADAIEPVAGKGGRRQARRDAEAVYDLAFGALQKYIAQRTHPSPAEVDHLVRFSLKGIGADPTKA
jgi:hypothetical protein